MVSVHFIASYFNQKTNNMRTIKLITLVGLLAFQVRIIQAQNAFEIDAGHTFVQFTINRFGMVDVTGAFRDVTGTIDYNAEEPEKTSTSIVIKTGSVDSGLDARDGAVKSKAFLDVATYPEITFISKKMTVKQGKMVVTGDLTIHGTTKEVTFPVTIKGPYKDPTQANTIAIKGNLTINRQDYGISFDRKLDTGSPFIGNEVSIQLDVLAFTK